MSKAYRICIVLIAAIVFTPRDKSFGQNEQDIAAFLQAGAEDASKLIQAYVEPAVKSMSFGMAGGWYNTAKTHKSLGFDLGVTMNMAFIPTSENYFDPTNLNLSATTYDGARSKGSTALFDPNRKAPTFFGPNDETQYTSDPDGPGGLAPVTFSGPEGLQVKKKVGFAATPTPMIQLGIGVIKNTDIKIRYVNSDMIGAIIPNVDLKNSEFSIFGVGVMHDIKQHIKGIKLLPFDLSALVAYNSVSGTSDVTNSNAGQGPVSTNGKFDYKFNSWVIQALISKKISVITGYAGAGYSIVNTNVDVKGDFDIDPSTGQLILTDPVAIDFKNNSMRLTLGARLKFGPIYFNGDYTFQKYNVFSFGLGCSVR